MENGDRSQPQAEAGEGGGRAKTGSATKRETAAKPIPKEEEHFSREPPGTRTGSGLSATGACGRISSFTASICESWITSRNFQKTANQTVPVFLFGVFRRLKQFPEQGVPIEKK